MILNKNNFKQEVEDFSGLVLVDFHAPWCGPCRLMSPLVDELINENKDKEVKIGKLDVDENQGIAAKYNVMSVPTFLVFKNGKLVDQKNGYGDKEELEQMIANNK